MQSEFLFTLLDNWVSQNWLRPIDRAFADFLHSRQPDTDAWVLLMAALTSHQLGRGHICLDLDGMFAEPDIFLGIPPVNHMQDLLPEIPSVILKKITVEKLGGLLARSHVVTTGDGDTPLVLTGHHLFMRRYWQQSRDVMNNIENRLKLSFEPPDDQLSRIDRLFAHLRGPGETDKTEVHWQSVAAAIASRSAFCIISGGPGTGKTTTVVQLLWLLQESALEQGHPLRIKVAAPTGKAAARLTDSIWQTMDKLPREIKETMPSGVTTLHRLLGRRPGTSHFVHNKNNPLHIDLLVVDEASMIGLDMMASLIYALPDRAQLILLGDKDQLYSVEAGSVLGDFCGKTGETAYWPETRDRVNRDTGYSLPAAKEERGTALAQHVVVLHKNHRFGENSGIGILAQAVNTGNPETVLSVFEKKYDDIVRLVVPSLEDEIFSRLVINGNHKAFAGEPAGYSAYLDLVRAGPSSGTCEDEWIQEILICFARFRLLTPLRKGNRGVEGINDRTAEILYKKGLIDARSGWYSGLPVMITRNNYNLGLMNGDTGIVLPLCENKNSGHKTLKVVFPMPDGTLKKVHPSRLNNVETAYAMTVHKSQGSEFEHTALIFPDFMNPSLTRELIYTAVTRSRRWFSLVLPPTDIFMEAVLNHIS